MYKVTIGIPIFNAEKYIEACLASALNQDFEDIEFILVDGFGTDMSMQLVSNLLVGHHRSKDVRIIKQKMNCGQGGDRNVIIQNANSDFIYFLDSDDEITNNCITVLYSEVVKDDSIDFVVGNNSTIYRDNHIVFSHLFKRIYSGKEDILNAYLRRQISGVTWNKLYRRLFLLNNNILNIHGNNSEDVGFQLQEMYYANKIAVISDVTYKYYKRSMSVTANELNYLTKRADVLIDLYEKMIIERQMGIECEVIIVEYLLILLYDLGIIEDEDDSYTLLLNNVYFSVLKSCHIKSLCKYTFSYKVKLCALIAYIRNDKIRLYYIRLLGKIGKIKRSVKI